MIDVEKVLNNPKQLISFTSLTKEEFDELLVEFEKDWLIHYKHHTLDGKFRKSPLLKDKKTTTLSSTNEKLFFILLLLKTNTLQEYHALQFDMSQTKVSIWHKCLLNILLKTLTRIKLTPSNKLEKLTPYIIDGIERPIERNVDYDAQREDFSGKKKRIHVKI